MGVGRVRPAEMQAKYSRRIQVDGADLNEGVLRYVQVTVCAKVTQ